MDLEDSGGGMGPETVYGTHEDSHVVMSEKVQSLAGSIYQEFERMIARYDEDVVKTLMPLLVNVLECLDAAYQSNQEHDVELELLREDNEQLVTQYEREKCGRKAAEQKLLEAEDASECERKELTARLEALESIVRMLELKHKNSMEHASRLEERESELKREYAKLHDRYTELFKTHMDYMERTKLLLSGGQLPADRAEIGRIPANRLNIGRSSGPVSFGFASLEGAAEGIDSIPTSPISSSHSSPSLHSELDGVNMGGGGGANNTAVGAVKMVEKALETDAVSLEHKGMVTSPSTPSAPAPAPTGRSQTRNERRSGNTLYQELSFQDSEALADVDEGADITGSWVHPGEYASSVNDNFFGMGKEVENLIMENNELLATKNALNVVKDDLIVKVDELTGEQEILREEITSLKIQRERSRARIADLEDEVRKLKEAIEAKTDNQDDDADVPMAQRKRFTRLEMARVLMERNQYKERFMELQEAVRWSELLRASRSNPALDKKNRSIWKFFSNLFGRSEQSLTPNLSYHAPTQHVSPGIRTLPRPGQEYLDTEIGAGAERLADRKAERREQYRQVRAHVRKEDGRLQAYGWSLPGKVPTSCPKGPSSTTSSSGGGGGGGSSSVPVPVPVYCRPLAETQPRMDIRCGAGVNMMGGHTRDGGLMVGGSVFYYDEPLPTAAPTQPASAEVESLDKELTAGREGAVLETQLSSLVWICSSTHNASSVTVIDANNPADILKTFPVCPGNVLCIASVPGASPADYLDTIITVNSSEPLPDKSDVDPEEALLGHVQYVELDLPPEDSTENPHTPNETSNEPPQVQTPTAAAAAANETPVQEEQPQQQPDQPVEKVEEVEVLVNHDENADETVSMATTSISTVASTTVTATNTGGGSNESIATASVAEEPRVDPTEEAQDTHEQRKREKWERKGKMSSVLATMWLGARNGMLYVHSSVANWDQCLHSVKLPDAVIAIVHDNENCLQITVQPCSVSPDDPCTVCTITQSLLPKIHVGGRVVAALANGSVAVFRRDADGQWDLSRYHIVQLGLPIYTVRCLAVVGDRVWCGYRNKVHVLDARALKIVHTLPVHPRKESEVRQLAWLGEGVWVTVRLDSTLRMYHAYTYEHLQDVDIEPYVSKMLGSGKLGFSYVRITALLISSNRLWIGTANGVIISVPLMECGMATNMGSIVARAGSGTLVPGSSVRVPATAGTLIPYCSMAQAQLSFHGHRCEVKFFIAVPGHGGMSAASTPSEVNQKALTIPGSPASKKPPAMLVLSGGEGYVDFRIGDGDMEESIVEGESNAGDVSRSVDQRREKGHLIVWQVTV